jgi:DNA polymerase I-like protein with 3'-5' exonuclease and polymerase domains
MLDEVNYPDSTCRWCGDGLTHAWESQLDNGQAWYHKSTQSKYCWEGAPAVGAPVKTTASGVAYIPTEAQKPFTLDGTKTGRMSNTNPDLSTIPNRGGGHEGHKHPLTKKPYIPKPDQQMYFGPIDEIRE